MILYSSYSSLSVVCSAKIQINAGSLKHSGIKDNV
jgi:hypothetical protein